MKNATHKLIAATIAGGVLLSTPAIANAQTTTGGQVTQGSKVGQFWKDECGTTDDALKAMGGKVDTRNIGGFDYFLRFMTNDSDCVLYQTTNFNQTIGMPSEDSSILLSKEKVKQANDAFGVNYFKENDVVIPVYNFSAYYGSGISDILKVDDNNPEVASNYTIKRQLDSKINPFSHYGQIPILEGKTEAEMWKNSFGYEDIPFQLITSKDGKYSISTFRGAVQQVIIHDKDLLASKDRYDYLVQHPEELGSKSKEPFSHLLMKDDFIGEIGKVITLTGAKEDPKSTKKKVFIEDINMAHVIDGGAPGKEVTFSIPDVKYVPSDISGIVIGTYDESGNESSNESGNKFVKDNTTGLWTANLRYGKMTYNESNGLFTYTPKDDQVRQEYIRFIMPYIPSSMGPETGTITILYDRPQAPDYQVKPGKNVINVGDLSYSQESIMRKEYSGLNSEQTLGPVFLAEGQPKGAILENKDFLKISDDLERNTGLNSKYEYGTKLTVPGEGVWTIEGNNVVFTPESGFTGTPTGIQYTRVDDIAVVLASVPYSEGISDDELKIIKDNAFFKVGKIGEPKSDVPTNTEEPTPVPTNDPNPNNGSTTSNTPTPSVTETNDPTVTSTSSSATVTPTEEPTSTSTEEPTTTTGGETTTPTNEPTTTQKEPATKTSATPEKVSNQDSTLPAPAQKKNPQVNTGGQTEHVSLWSKIKEFFA